MNVCSVSFHRMFYRLPLRTLKTQKNDFYFCTQTILCFLLPVKSTGNDTLPLSITNTGVFKGTGHHQLCNCFYYF